MVTKEEDCLPLATEPPPRCYSPSSTPLAVLENVRSLEIVEPSFLSPVWLLVIFCIINLLNYMDRGAIASNGVNGSTRSCNDKGKCNLATGIQGHFNLSNFEDGVLSSSLMVGLLIASPIFASLAKSFNPFRLIGVGLTVWSIAVLGCGSSFAFWFIVLCRIKLWLGVFYMCIPSGVALGYVYGGYVGKHFSWRYAFWGEAVLMAPFALLGFTSSDSTKTVRSIEVMASSVEAETSKNSSHLQAGNEIEPDQFEVSIETYNLCISSAGSCELFVFALCETESKTIINGISTVAIHIFGDVPSSPLVGILEDHIENWRKTALILTSILFLAAAIWFIDFVLPGIFINSVDRFNEEESGSENQMRQEQSILTP